MSGSKSVARRPASIRDGLCRSSYTFAYMVKTWIFRNVLILLYHCFVETASETDRYVNVLIIFMVKSIKTSIQRDSLDQFLSLFLYKGLC
jgi:hypothetical protein